MTTVTHVKAEQQCLDSARRAIAWLLEQQAADGGWKPLRDAPVDAFYKVGAAFSLLGEPAAAERLFDHVRSHHLQPDGDFGPRLHPWHNTVHYPYANGWLVISAQKQGRVDVAVPAQRFLLTQQDPHHGGFYSLKAVGESTRSDTMSTGIAGIACLAAGHIKAAERAAGCLETMIDRQPDADARFYATIEADGRLGTAYPDEEALWRVVDAGEKDQCWYAVGLPFAFAILLHQATGNQRYARLADWFFSFQQRCVNPWDGGSSGKAAWGCSMLYRLTGDPCYRDVALRVAHNFMACQTPGGWFEWGRSSGYGASDDEIPAREWAPGDFDATAEFANWLVLIGSHLLARDGP